MERNDIIQKLVEQMPEHFDLKSMELRKSSYYRAYEANLHKPRPVKTALGFRAFLTEKPIILSEYDILAGLIQHYDVSASMAVKYNEGYDPRISLIYTRQTDIHRLIDECVQMLDAEKDEAQAMYTLIEGDESGLFAPNPYGHVIPQFEKLIHSGFGALLDDVRSTRSKEGLNKEQKEYLDAMEIVLEASSEYFLRCGEEAQKLANTVMDDSQRSNLQRIADTCTRTSLTPAQTFFDAVQMTILLQELITIETASGSMSLGRMDQLFYEYYKSDLAVEGIDAEEAQSIIDAWRIKLAGLLQGFQNTVICGCDKNGKFAGNEISLMILRSARRLRFDQPLLSMRYTKDMPDEYWEEALQLIELGDGFPALFNDEVIIASREEMGICPEHAKNYGIVGCVEPSIQGMEFSNTEEMRINWLKLLELMFNEGACAFTETKFRMRYNKTLEDIGSYEEFLAWFKDELVNFIEQAARGCDLVDSIYYRCFPSPMLSSVMEGCIENACDVADKMGTIYRFSTINNCGMSNVVDSLLAVKKIVFEEKLVTLPQLKNILDEDFKGYENIRQFALNRCEKFGNDMPAADELMKELIDLASQTINQIPNCRGFHFQTGMYSIDQHASFGMKTFASPDGRKKGVSLANGLSPVQGMDKEGPTAVINAITAFDHKQLGNGMVLDLKFPPSMFRNATHRKLIRTLVDTYFNKGGMEIQFNVVDKETLLEAQKDPTRYENLLVRVSGFSAYFVNLFKELQDEIINRTENGSF